MPITESIVEDAALAWLESLGYSVAHGPEIAPEQPESERSDYGKIVLERRLRDALKKLISGELRVPDTERIVGELVS